MAQVPPRRSKANDGRAWVVGIKSRFEYDPRSRHNIPGLNEHRSPNDHRRRNNHRCFDNGRRIDDDRRHDHLLFDSSIGDSFPRIDFLSVTGNAIGNGRRKQQWGRRDSNNERN